MTDVDPLSQLPNPPQPRNGVVGCLLDVSGSMQGALEAGRADEPAVERLQAALRAVLKVAKAEQRQHPATRVFVGLFGLNSDKIPGCPVQLDLCSVIEALLGDPSDCRSGHDLLVDLAKENGRAHIEKHIRTKLKNDQARFVHIHLQQRGRESRIKNFLDRIPSDEAVEAPGKQVRGAVQSVSNKVEVVATAVASLLGGSPSLITSPPRPTAGSADQRLTLPRTGVSCLVAECGEVAGCLTDSAVHTVEGWLVDKSDARTLADSIYDEWLADFATFVPRPVTDIVDLLTRLQERIDGPSDSRLDDAPKTDFLDTLSRYLFGRTPMKHSVNEALKVFHEFDKTADGQHVLLLISDGLSTDGNPLQILDETSEKNSNVTIATVFLTSDRDAAPRRIYDKPLRSWEEDGRITLFNMASKVSVATHPIPVMTTLGWQIPSSGEGALFATVCSATALEEFCSITVSTRFASADELLDALGRWNMDEHVEDIQRHTRKTPSRQSGPTCYAHAAAAVVYMALHRIVGRAGGYPSIRDIRTKIMSEFPWNSPVWQFDDLLKSLTTWESHSNATCQGAGYRPLRFREVNETGARDAVLRRRPVLATFFLSEDGWDAFEKHFEMEETRKSTLELQHMDEHRCKPPSNEGHAVVLVRCNPTSLIFLNSWGSSWGDEGLFSISDPAVLETEDPSFRMRFYDMFWLEEDLTNAECAAYNDKVDKFLQTYSEKHPSILLLEAQCPNCLQTAPIAKFKGSIRKALCPNPHCKTPEFKPESDHIRRAL